MYVISIRLAPAWWTGWGWSADYREARRFPSRADAESHARRTIGARVSLWTVSRV
jgi:hypothetical protein